MPAPPAGPTPTPGAVPGRAVRAHDRLQPALLDRLAEDDGAGEGPAAPEARRAFTRAQLRAAVLRDLRWLLNASQPLPPHQQSDARVAASVLNFGLPPLAGLQASRLDIHELERLIAKSIRDFEPRILPQSLVVRAVEPESVLETHNRIDFEIRGLLWAQPVPLEVLLRTRLDLEAGQVDVSDQSPGVPVRAA